jgi:hypothetical protein
MAKYARKTLYMFAVALVIISVSVSVFAYNYVLNLNPTKSSFTAEELLTAPEQIEIDNRSYVMDTYLSRDFMPRIVDDLSQPVHSPIMASITINSTDKQDFPSSVNTNRLWLIKNQTEVWEIQGAGEKQAPLIDSQLIKVYRNGPEWGTPDSLLQVDVVIEIIHEGNAYWLKASNQTIWYLM